VFKVSKKYHNLVIRVRYVIVSIEYKMKYVYEENLPNHNS
jgi:hypothetical protein